MKSKYEALIITRHYMTSLYSLSTPLPAYSGKFIQPALIGLSFDWVYGLRTTDTADNYLPRSCLEHRSNVVATKLRFGFIYLRCYLQFTWRRC